MITNKFLVKDMRKIFKRDKIIRKIGNSTWDESWTIAGQQICGIIAFEHILLLK